jgi:Tol biopolymer transport system component
MGTRAGTTRAVLALTVGAALLAVAPNPAAGAAPASLLTTRASVASDGSQGNGMSQAPSISGDGRLVVFSSAASNLVPGDTNDAYDVFVRDRVAGTTERISLTSDDHQANAQSYGGRISDDGRYVVFGSYASNLVPGPPGFYSQGFVRDLVTGTTELVSVATNGTLANQGVGDFDISGDGRYVAFVSWATNLDGADTNAKGDVFLRDRQAGTTVRVSEATDGTQANQESFAPTVSDDGLVAWQSFANNLVAADTNNRDDIFLHDPHTSATTRVSLAEGGSQSADSASAPDLSADGSHLAYMLDSGNYSVVVRHLASGSIDQVSVNSEGAPGDGGSYYPSISADGRHVLFFSRASNFAAGDTDDLDLFVRDRAAGTTQLVSVSAHGVEVINTCCHVEYDLSADGSHVAFEGWWADATYVEDDTNQHGDIFVVSPAGPDITGPAITPVVSPTPGDDGWNTEDATLRWRLLDPESNLTSRTGCDPATVDADTDADGTTYTCTATSGGGTTVQTVTIRRDGTAPTITGSVSPAAPDGINGWYVTSPVVSFTCGDTVSGIAECPEAVSVGESADEASVIRQATDVAGNQASGEVAGLKVDLSDPQVACDTRPAFTLGEPGQVTGRVTDAISGPVSATAAADADTTKVGARRVPVIGSDLAGRTAPADCGYDVHYAYTGFLGAVENAPTLNKVSAGKAVGIKFRLDGFQGKRVVTAAGSAPVACSSKELVAPKTQYGTTTTYLTGTETYKYAWSTKAGWRGTCRVFTLSLKDGTEHQARFKFTR